MKKTMTLLLSLFIILVFATACMANPGNGKALGKKADKIEQSATSTDGETVGEIQPTSTSPDTIVVTKHDQASKNRQKIKVKNQLKTKFAAALKQAQLTECVQLKDIEKNWAGPSIKLLYAAGLISGYPDGTFKPQNSVTQAEVIALATKLADEEQIEADGEEATEQELQDVPAWVRGSVQFAAININRFHSNVQASRAQTAVWIAKAIGLQPVDIGDMPFKDGILISPEDAGYILALYQEGIIKGTPDGKFNPNNCITRAEIAIIMEKILEDREVESISLPETATVEQGSSITLAATVKYTDGSSDNKATWSSSDPELATVNNGVVTAADDQTGTVTITATALGDTAQTASCEVTVKEKIEPEPAELESTGNIGIHAGKIYQEYKLMADGVQIDLDEDNVSGITMQKDSESAVALTPTADTALWFNVQRDSGDYVFKVENQSGTVYQATLDWTAPQTVTAVATGNTGEHDGYQYTEYQIGELDLSSFSKMYQIKPDGSVTELTANADTTLWFKTTDQQTGDHTFLIYEDGTWYQTTVTF